MFFDWENVILAEGRTFMDTSVKTRDRIDPFFSPILGKTLLVSLLHSGLYTPHEWAPRFPPRPKSRFLESEARVEIML